MKWSFFWLLILLFCIAGCKITQSIKNGQMAYELKQYAVAIPLLEEEYRKAGSDTERGQKARLLGDCHDFLIDYLESSRWYEKASNHNVNVDAKLASAYKKSEQYAKALEKYQKLCKIAKEAQWCQEAALCKRAIREPRDPYVEISNFSSNSKYADYSPVFFGEEFLVFTSDRSESLGEETYNWTGNAFSDLFVLNLQGRKVNNFDAVINTAANEGTACFSQDLNEIYFTRCESINLRDQHCRIYFSQRPNGFWMEPEPLHFFDERTNFAHATLIENDSVLVFSAAPFNSDGTYDLYYSERIEGGWSAPDLMPSKINSNGNEKFSSSYGDTLYFASDGLLGYGGYDIFKTHLNNGTWATPQNLGRPINSGADDFGVAIDVKGTNASDIALQGYLSSSRNIGTSDDIFFFTIYEDEDNKTEGPVDPIVEVEKEPVKIYIAARVVELKHEDDDPNKKIVDRSPLPAASLLMNSGGKDKQVGLDRRGFAIRETEEGKEVKITASLPGFLASEVTVKVPINPLSDTTINVELALDKIVYDKEIVLNDIYYDYDKWAIRDDAKPSLDSLSKIMILNPQINIQLGAHTDCQGSDDYNQELSQKRAFSAKDYLIGKGIALSRVQSVGFGESTPIDSCVCDDCTEAQHQINRRTSFKILRL